MDLPRIIQISIYGERIIALDENGEVWLLIADIELKTKIPGLINIRLIKIVDPFTIRSVDIDENIFETDILNLSSKSIDGCPNVTKIEGSYALNADGILYKKTIHTYKPTQVPIHVTDFFLTDHTIIATDDKNNLWHATDKLCIKQKIPEIQFLGQRSAYDINNNIWVWFGMKAVKVLNMPNIAYTCRTDYYLYVLDNNGKLIIYPIIDWSRLGEPEEIPHQVDLLPDQIKRIKNVKSARS